MSKTQDHVDLSQPRYNLDSYAGRLQHFYGATDPRTLLVPKAALLQAQGRVQRVEQQVKDAGGRGVWVSQETRANYWKDRARACPLSSSSSGGLLGG